MPPGGQLGPAPPAPRAPALVCRQERDLSIERCSVHAWKGPCPHGSTTAPSQPARPLAGAPGVAPWDALDLLQHEILEYSERLDTLPALVVANKLDLLPAPAAALRALRQRTDLPVVGVSAREHQGMPELLAALRRAMAEGAAAAA